MLPSANPAIRAVGPLAALAACLALLAWAVPARAAVSSSASVLLMPAELRPAVAFWTDIYSRYTSDQTVLHDSERLDVVYGVLDFAELGATPLSDWQRARTRANAEELEKERIRNLLRDIALYADRPEQLTLEQKRIFELFPEDGVRVLGARFLEAADRVRSQVGQRDRFIEGIRTGGRYLPEIERIFESEGVPVELSRLSFVESMFNLQARSAVGASGVWQFMRSTGRLYLRIDDLVDERNDPLLAARGAARLLAHNYAELQTWPLAITAYNHGKAGILRAVTETGSRDLGRIIAEYRGPSFGFASRNFYAEFMAALHVERNARRYFGPIKIDEPHHYALVAMPGHLTAADLARHAKIDVNDLRALNPALTDRALRSARPLPKGYALRVPADRRGRLVAARFDVRPGWRPPAAVAVAAAASAGSASAVHAAAAVGPTLGPLALARADQPERLVPLAPPAPQLDPEIYRAQVMAAEEEALNLFLVAASPAAAEPGATAGDDAPGEASGDAPSIPVGAEARVAVAAATPAPAETVAPGVAASPPEASGDRLVGAAVEALEARQPPSLATLATASEGARSEGSATLRPGRRVLPSVSPTTPTFRTAVRGGETVWRLAEWSEEPAEAFRARNRLAPDQPLPAGRPVSVSTAKVDRETFEARRAAFHEALRERAAREFGVVGTRPHQVQPGETPWRLAETNKVPYWLLEQANPGRDLSAVRAGDTLLLPIVRPE